MGQRRTIITKAELQRLLKAARGAGFDDVRLTPSGEVRFLVAASEPASAPAGILQEIEEWARES